jgi:biotin carboxylase
VVLICPTGWDEQQLPGVPQRVRDRYRIRTYGPDAEHAPEAFDADAFITTAVAALAAEPVDGVTSSSDYPGGLVAAFIAHELGLPAPDPKAVLTCSHKYYARLSQRASVPEATPRFELINPDQTDEQDPPLEFPVFVKPVKSWFSQYARRIESPEELALYTASTGLQSHLSDFLQPFNQLLARYGDFVVDGDWLLAEEVLVGHQVTLEAFVSATVLHVIGVVDSIMHEETLSFRHFRYPSTIPQDVAERMAHIAGRAVAHVGFDNGVCNVEFMYNSALDTIHIIEINPRMCGQFADMMESVNGINTYEILFAISTGMPPPFPFPGGDSSVAASFPLRHFTDAIVAAAPDRAQIEAVKRHLPVTLATSYYRAGERLSSNTYHSDGASYRYAVVNLAGRSWPELFRDADRATAGLAFRLMDLSDSSGTP